MPRPAIDTRAAAELGHRLTRQRKRRKQPSYRTIARDIALTTNGGIDITDEQIRKMHAGQVDPHTCDINQLIGLAAFYRVDLEVIHPVAATRARAMLNTLADLGFDASGCTSPIAA